MPKLHIMAFTYKPKIEAVFAKRCRKTLRLTRKIEEGDTLLIHDWTGLPYRSKWGRRLYQQVLEVQQIIVDRRGLTIFDPENDAWYSQPWGGQGITFLAKQDGIVAPIDDDRPLGEIWFDVITKLNDGRISDEQLDIGIPGSLITWGDFDV